MAIDTQHPFDLRRDFLLQLDDSIGKLFHLATGGIIYLFGADREQHFRLEHETIADDTDVFAGGQDFTQAAEEIGTVAVELLHALGQRNVQATPKISDLGVGFLVAVLRSVERLFTSADLSAQGCYLLVKQLDLAESALADSELAFDCQQ